MIHPDFKGRCLLLTGASGGIGKSIAATFAAAGASLVLADRDAQALATLATQLAPLDTKIVTTVMDAADPGDARRCAELASAHFGAIDFVVTTAGIYRDEPAATMTTDQWRQTLAINLDGVFHICAAAIPHLAPNSAMVHLTSMAAHMGGSLGHSHYGAAKGGVLAYTRGLARELGPKTRVNAVSPGIIETAMTGDIIAARGDLILDQTPMKRFGTGDDIASVVAFLCSDAAAFITGEAIHVNGGYYMGG
jgi:3-oxoacyl-[acyl-carrier protein] reductase